MPTLVLILLQLSLARGTLAAGVTEMDECIKILPQCVHELWESNQRGDAANEEELSFGLLAAWMKGLYTKKDPPYLASDLQLRASTLQQLKELASFSLASPDHFKYAIGVGQMLFLYFWWGLHPPDDEHNRLLGPSIEIVSLSASLHTASVAGTCSSPGIAQIEFEARKCPWRWRFVLLLLVEMAKQLAAYQDLKGAAEHFRLAQAHLKTMRMLPYFAHHRSLLPGEGPYRANHNDDLLRRSQHWPVWPRSAWPPVANFLEEHAHIFRAELDRLILADMDYDELFRTVQEQQTEFTPLPKDWGLLDLIRQGNRTAVCAYTPQSCALLEGRPEINAHCFSERVPNAGVAFARLLPGSEIKPHFATEPRLAIHLGLITPPGAEMWVANETVTWSEGKAVVFDDTFSHGVRHRGIEARYILLAWICHPCDLHWRSSAQDSSALPPHCDKKMGDSLWFSRILYDILWHFFWHWTRGGHFSLHSLRANIERSQQRKSPTQICPGERESTTARTRSTSSTRCVLHGATQCSWSSGEFRFDAMMPLNAIECHWLRPGYSKIFENLSSNLWERVLAFARGVWWWSYACTFARYC